jgi:predicted extracellular nuclease
VPRVRGLVVVALASLVVVLVGGASQSRAVPAVSPDVVVSQVYGGGGNSGATLKNDFIELFNRGSTTVAVTGWSVQYASAAGSSWTATNLSGSIAPGQHYLIQEGAGGGGTVNLPTPDATGTIAMSATSAKVALVTNQALLSCSTGCLPNASIRDFVGYGSSASSFEGAGPTSTLSNTTGALRGGNGCVDTDSNPADFAAGAPNPRNTAAPADVCLDATPAVTSTTPANGAFNVPVSSNVTITFSEPVNVAGTWFSITCSSSGAHTAAASGGPTTFTLDPDADFAGGEACTVTVFASQVTDQDTDDPPDDMASDASFGFTTVGPTRIHTIQDAAHLSPFVGKRFGTVPGIVTALRANGFHLQDPSPDASDATSEAIFVFTGSAPTVGLGDSLEVAGTVTEFRPGGASSTNLTTTELTSPSITVLSSGSPLPAPVVVGTGGRLPPGTVIEDDAAGSVETSGVFDPGHDGIDFYESLEAMRVQLNNAVAVGPTASFGEIPVLANNGAGAALRTARGGIVIRPTDFNPERVILDDGILPMPLVNVRDSFPGATVGVVDYTFGNFKLEVTSLPASSAGGLAREVTAAVRPNELAFATFNVENLDPADPQAKFDELAGLIVNNLRSPDLLSLEEVQDANGPTNDSVVDASPTYAKLIAAIQSAGGPTYDFRQIDPVDDQDGGEPGGNIRVGFLFRTDRGLQFVDRPGGTSTSPVSVVAGPNGPQLSFSPGRIDPTNPAFTSSRKPLAGELKVGGETLFVIANHWNSKGGDEPLFGRFQPPNRVSEVQRSQQAQVVAGFVESILAADAHARVIVLGDLNDFEFSTALALLKGGGLDNLVETLPRNQRYTYVFEGNSQTLDHVLVSGALAQRVRAFDVVHVNAEFATQASDHDPSVARIRLR